MHPRTDINQRCLNFHLSVSPRCRLFSYRDYLGNQVHHFDIPVPHDHLVIVAESLVEVQPPHDVPARMAPESWNELDNISRGKTVGRCSCRANLPSPALYSMRWATCWASAAKKTRIYFLLLHQMNTGLHTSIAYVPKSTKVSSPIDSEALKNRQGVCQDFSHIMIALARSVGVPCRYVSGYVYSQRSRHRSPCRKYHPCLQVEALLPHLGWVGFDPTSGLPTGGQHIRTAIGRDYADVPPTKGVFPGPHRQRADRRRPRHSFRRAARARPRVTNT